MMATVQRYMARTVFRAARRVWMAIPGWEERVLSLLRPSTTAAGVLPVPGTIPVVDDAAALSELRRRLARRGGSIVGYFGAGGDYAERAVSAAIRTLLDRRSGSVLVCIGRGSDYVARTVAAGVSQPEAVTATGALDPRALSLHLQACDVLVQPYVDGVSGRRTTTISALEHGVPVATTFGRLSEPFWRTTSAVELVDADSSVTLGDAVTTLLEPARSAEARSSALTLYRARFDPAVALEPLFAD
jgi:glycosyltransferase involved in cell wall biosynthesis